MSLSRFSSGTAERESGFRPSACCLLCTCPLPYPYSDLGFLTQTPLESISFKGAAAWCGEEECKTGVFWLMSFQGVPQTSCDTVYSSGDRHLGILPDSPHRGVGGRDQ